MFENLDTNHDGVLSRDEFAAMAHGGASNKDSGTGNYHSSNPHPSNNDPEPVAELRQRRRSGYRDSAPAEIVLPVRQIAIALARDLKHRIADRGLHGRAAVVPHAEQPVARREEADRDLGRILIDA